MENLPGSTEIVPVSAVTGAQVDVLVDVLAGALPPGPAYYPDGELTDEPEEVLMAEFIREAALRASMTNCPIRWPWLSTTSARATEGTT